MKLFKAKKLIALLCTTAIIFTTTAGTVFAKELEVKDNNQKTEERKVQTKTNEEVNVNIKLYTKDKEEKLELFKTLDPLKGKKDSPLEFELDKKLGKIIEVKGEEFKLKEDKVVGIFKNDTTLEIIIEQSNNQTEAIKPVEETKPTEATKPVEETKPTETTKPVEETKPTETTKPVEETKPIARDFNLTIEIYAFNEKGNNTLYSKYTRIYTEGKRIVLTPADIYNGEIVKVEGEEFKIVDKNIVGTIKEDTVLKVTAKFKDKFAPTEIVFLDENSNPVINAPKVTIHEEPGTKLQYKIPEIKGYKYVGAKELTVPNYDTEGFGVLYLNYERLPLELTINYVDIKGNILIKPDTVKGKAGDKVNIPLATINGYIFKGVEYAELPLENVKDIVTIAYEFKVENQTLTLIYDKIKPVATNTTKVQKPPVKTLPQTGITKTYTAIAGIALIAVGFVVFTKKRNLNK